MDCQKNTANNINMTGKQYVKKRKTFTIQFVKRKQIITKLVNKIATHRSLCNVCTSEKSTFYKPIKPITNKTNKKQKQFSQITKTCKLIVWGVKNTHKICPKELIMMTNKEIKGKPTYSDCMANKSFSDEIKHKSELEIKKSQFLMD